MYQNTSKPIRTCPNMSKSVFHKCSQTNKQLVIGTKETVRRIEILFSLIVKDFEASTSDSDSSYRLLPSDRQVSEAMLSGIEECPGYHDFQLCFEIPLGENTRNEATRCNITESNISPCFVFQRQPPAAWLLLRIWTWKSESVLKTVHRAS